MISTLFFMISLLQNMILFYNENYIFYNTGRNHLYSMKLEQFLKITSLQG